MFGKKTKRIKQLEHDLANEAVRHNEAERMLLAAKEPVKVRYHQQQDLSWIASIVRPDPFAGHRHYYTYDRFQPAPRPEMFTADTAEKAVKKALKSLYSRQIQLHLNGVREARVSALREASAGEVVLP